MPHRYGVGRLVRLARAKDARNGARIYEVRTLLPEADGEPRYRVHSHEAGTVEVGERDLIAASRQAGAR